MFKAVTVCQLTLLYTCNPSPVVYLPSPLLRLDIVLSTLMLLQGQSRWVGRDATQYKAITQHVKRIGNDSVKSPVRYCVIVSSRGSTL